MHLLVATTNHHKAREIGAMLVRNVGANGRSPLHIHTLDEFSSWPEVIEDGETFITNATKKARVYADACQMLTLADDSGLCVDALGGDPGVYSARYAGEGATGQQLCEKLLDELRDVPDGQRGAHFCCAMALAWPTTVIGAHCNVPLQIPSFPVGANGRSPLQIHLVEGRVDGMILREPRGENGFGYDPIFFYPPLNKTFAELSADEKNQVSHRARALQKISAFIFQTPSARVPSTR